MRYSLKLKDSGKTRDFTLIYDFNQIKNLVIILPPEQPYEEPGKTILLFKKEDGCWEEVTGLAQRSPECFGQLALQLVNHFKKENIVFSI